MVLLTPMSMQPPARTASRATRCSSPSTSVCPGRARHTCMSKYSRKLLPRSDRQGSNAAFTTSRATRTRHLPHRRENPSSATRTWIFTPKPLYKHEHRRYFCALGIRSFGGEAAAPRPPNTASLSSHEPQGRSRILVQHLASCPLSKSTQRPEQHCFFPRYIQAWFPRCHSICLPVTTAFSGLLSLAHPIHDRPPETRVVLHRRSNPPEEADLCFSSCYPQASTPSVASENDLTDRRSRHSPPGSRAA